MLRTHCRGSLLKLDQMRLHGGRQLSRKRRQGRCAVALALPAYAHTRHCSCRQLSVGWSWSLQRGSGRVCLQSSKAELAEGHEAEVGSLTRVIEGLRCRGEELQAELAVLRGREQQHLGDLQQAQERIADLRLAAQQAEQSQASLCSAALEQAASCRWRIVRLIVCWIGD